MSGTYAPIPTIILKGRWLKAAGFEVGEYVEVTCEGDKIALIKTKATAVKVEKSLEDKIKGF